MDIKYDDDQHQCKYCGRYGHLICKCRTKAADHLRNQQHQPETHVTKWRETKEAHDDEEELELTKLNKNYQENLNAVADVYEAALIAIEGTYDYEERKKHITELYREEQAEMMQQLEDSMHFLADDFAERNDRLDEQFVSSGGIIPPPSIK